MTVSSHLLPGPPYGPGRAILDADVAAEVETKVHLVGVAMQQAGRIPRGASPELAYGMAVSEILRRGFAALAKEGFINA